MPENKTERLELRITPTLMSRIDAARGDVSRTRYVERAIEDALAIDEPESNDPDSVSVDLGDARVTPGGPVVGRASLVRPSSPAKPAFNRATSLKR